MKKTLGTNGEKIGENYLLSKGYTFVERNYTCRFGEIDLIFKDKETLVAVEVKSRKSLNYGYPCESITENKKKHLIKSFYNYMKFKGIKQMNMRIDVIEVFFDYKNNVKEINHIENAI